MEGVEMIQEIRGELARNGGKWDLTDDCGEPIYDFEKDVNIPELALNDEEEVCVLIPLGNFCYETIERIYQTVI